MTWSIHPANDNIVKTVVSLVFIFSFLIFILIFYGPLLAALGLAFLFVSLHSFYFKTTYEIDAESVSIKTVFGAQKRKLKEFKKLYKGKNGVLLSPFKRKTFLNNFRGLFLYYPKSAGAIMNQDINEYLEKVFTENATTN
ncbi:MAG TPA: hypothetical protein VF399_04070 [bacterium]